LVPDFAAVAAADDGGFRGHGEVGRNSDGDFEDRLYLNFLFKARTVCFQGPVL
jgi:hypothetical protein